MRVLACSLLLSACLSAQNPEASRLFAIPQGLDKTWPDAVLTDSEKNLLREAVESNLRDLEKNCEEKSAFDSLNKTSVALGTLGKGVIVATRGSCSCGTAGNCPIYLYVRDKDRYREVLRNGKRIPYGWAFAVVDSKADVPDIVLATHDSVVEQRLTKYQSVNGRFALQACETLTAKNSDSGPKNWWDPDEVSVQPCETH